MKIVNVGVIGYGLSGRIFHGAIINGIEGFNIKKIVTRDPKKKELAQKEIEGVVVVESAKEIFEDDTIDLVVISTPNTTHALLAEEAMNSGKNVVIEKPFTVTSEEGWKLVNIAKVTGKLLSVYQNRRFDGDFKTIKNILNEGHLGRLVEFESHFDRFRNQFKANSWREENIPGSGILYDLGAHLIDQALDLFGIPEEVYGDVRSQRKGEIDDNFELILYYPDLKVTLKSGSLVKEPLPRFILQGTEGGFVKFGLDVQEDALRRGERPKDNTWGEEPESMWGTLNTVEERKSVRTENGDYQDYYRNIYDAIINNEDLIVTGEHALNVIKIIEAAIRSNNEKRRVSI